MKLVGFTALAFFTLVAWITVETYFLLKRMES